MVGAGVGWGRQRPGYPIPGLKQFWYQSLLNIVIATRQEGSLERPLGVLLCVLLGTYTLFGVSPSLALQRQTPAGRQ